MYTRGQMQQPPPRAVSHLKAWKEPADRFWQENIMTTADWLLSYSQKLK
jgi:hypothetical protein